jgi:hypothetical protein
MPPPSAWKSIQLQGTKSLSSPLGAETSAVPGKSPGWMSRVPASSQVVGDGAGIGFTAAAIWGSGKSGSAGSGLGSVGFGRSGVGSVSGGSFGSGVGGSGPGLGGGKNCFCGACLGSVVLTKSSSLSFHLRGGDSQPDARADSWRTSASLRSRHFDRFVLAATDDVELERAGRAPGPVWAVPDPSARPVPRSWRPRML